MSWSVAQLYNSLLILIKRIQPSNSGQSSLAFLMSLVLIVDCKFLWGADTLSIMTLGAYAECCYA